MIRRIRNKFQHQDNRVLLSNFFSLLSLQGLTYVLPLITMPYLFRVLGAEKYGLIAFALSTVMFIKVLVDYGFHLSATREISVNRDNKKRLIEIFSTTLTIKLILLIFGFFILTLLVFLEEKFYNNWQLFYMTFIFVVGDTLFPIWFFQGIQKMKYISYLNIVSKLLFTVGVFVFIHSPDDYLLYPLLNGLGALVISLFSLVFIRKKYQIKLVRQPIGRIKKTFKSSWDIFLSEFMPNLYNNFSVFLLGFVTTMDNVGYYSLATRIINVFNSVLYIIRNVTFPYLNKNFDKFKSIAKIIIVTGLLFSITILGLSHVVVPFIFGEKAYNSLDIIHILALSPLLLSIAISFGANKLLVLKKDKAFRNITFRYSVFGFIGAVILVPFFNIFGASINLILTRGLMAYLIFRKAKKIKL